MRAQAALFRLPELLKRVKAIERAAVSDLTEVPGISAETARKIYDFFHERPQS